VSCAACLCRQSGVGQGRAGQRTEGRREGEHDPRTQSNRRRHSNAHPNHNTLNSTHTTHGNKASLPFFLARRPVAISAFLFLWPLFERPRLFFSFFLRSRLRCGTQRGVTPHSHAHTCLSECPSVRCSLVSVVPRPARPSTAPVSVNEVQAPRVSSTSASPLGDAGPR
jgi:hypothetical protein